LQAAAGIIVILFSILLFLFVNTNLIKKKKTVETGIRFHVDNHSANNNNKRLSDVFGAELKNYNKNTSSIFEKNLTVITKQIESFNKKKRTIDKLLAEKFDTTEMTYQKFSNVVAEVEALFQTNVENVASKIKSFDEAQMHISQKEISQEYHKFILKATEHNEEIILKIDKLILEISKLKYKIHEDIESLDAIKEIDLLTKNIKLYN
jgi:DNA-directed RNA polymerase beta' subunit